MKSIAFFTHYATYTYGSNRSLIGLIDGLRSHDLRMLVVHPSDPYLNSPAFQEMLWARGVETLKMPFSWWVSKNPTVRGSVSRLVRNIVCALFIARRLRDWGCDMIYTNTSVIPIGAMVAALMRRPHIWHLREFGRLDHGLVPDWGMGVHRRIIGRATVRIAVSNAVRAYFVPERLYEKTHVIYNGIASRADFSALRTRSEEQKTDSDRITYAIIGYISQQKGQEEAIRALALINGRLDSVRLLVVGEGDQDYVNYCKGLVVKLGLEDRVEFWGYCDDPYEAILEADVILVCSRSEGMGRVAVESMAACRPVIGLDRAGTSELIRDGYNGLLYDGGTENLAACMVRLGGDLSLARRFGLNGWNWASETCCIERYAENIYRVITSVLGHQELV